MSARLDSLRVALVAPIVGTAVTLLPLFVLSHAGVPIGDCAQPVVATLIIASAVVLALRRPRVTADIVPVLVICVIALILVAWPMAGLGFRWISNANDDMANYVLSATHLLDHGLLTPLDVAGLSNDRNYPAASQGLHTAGSRPGADMMLAALADLTGRHPYEVFTPLIIALHLCGICGVAALAMQGSRRPWAAWLAAALLAVAPLHTFGVLQQLLPQVWGLGLATALFAFALHPKLHRGAGAETGELIVIGVLTAAAVAVYVELVSTLAAVYAVYFAVLVLQRQVAVRPVLRLWTAAIVVPAIFLNTYLIRELQYVTSQATSGLAPPAGTSPFGFTLIPSALPGVAGLLSLPPDDRFMRVGPFIVVAMLMLAVVLAAAVVTTLRGVAASTVVVTYAALGVVLWLRSSDFGLYKLYMYLQPFLAATVAVVVARIGRQTLLPLVAAPIALVVTMQVLTQWEYVQASRNPIDLPNASSEDLLPAFRNFFQGANAPVVSVTEHPTLGKLEAATSGGRPLYFISKNLFSSLVGSQQLDRLDGWRDRSFKVRTTGSLATNKFEENIHASAIMAADDCAIVIPTGTQTVLNRRSLPEGSDDLAIRSCRRVRNLVVFTSSELGEGFYNPSRRKRVSLYQLERDYFRDDRTMSGMGRYVLLRLVGPSDRVRLVVDFTKTFSGDGSALPPAAVVGAERAPFAVLGRGSARVFSQPLRPQTISGLSYVLLDVGVEGRVRRPRRRGIEGLYRRSVVVDVRYLTTYARDISLISDAAYRRLRPPAMVQRFPADLANPDLEYSGIYEDGLVGENSYAVLAGGPRTNLIVRADVLPRDDQRLDVFMNGVKVATKEVDEGRLALQVRVPASRSRRRVELRWAGAIRLGPSDPRLASARLSYLGFTPMPPGP